MRQPIPTTLWYTTSRDLPAATFSNSKCNNKTEHQGKVIIRKPLKAKWNLKFSVTRTGLTRWRPWWLPSTRPSVCSSQLRRSKADFSCTTSSKLPAGRVQPKSSLFTSGYHSLENTIKIITRIWKSLLMNDRAKGKTWYWTLTIKILQFRTNSRTGGKSIRRWKLDLNSKMKRRQEIALREWVYYTRGSRIVSASDNN